MTNGFKRENSSPIFFNEVTAFHPVKDTSLSVETIPHMETVSEYAFETYLEDVKRDLEKLTPAWSVHCQLASPSPGVSAHYYHLFQTDFSQGRVQPEGFYLTSAIFAWALREGDHKTYHILLKSPISSRT